MNGPKTRRESAGFSLTELAVVVAIFLVLLIIAIPDLMQMLRAYRLSGDARGLARQLTLARQRAGTDFTWAQIVVTTTTTPVSYNLQICTTKATSTCTTFTNDTGGGTQYLSNGISLGFGSSSGPAGGQSTQTQTTTVIFNSRGIPINSAGTAIATDTIYLTDDQGHAYAVAVTLSGHVQIYHWNGGAGWGNPL